MNGPRIPVDTGWLATLSATVGAAPTEPQGLAGVFGEDGRKQPARARLDAA